MTTPGDTDQDHSRVMLSAQFSEAVDFARGLHAEQRRKLTGAPYLGHLLRVAGLVLEYGGAEDEAIAALLHDAIEDQGGATAREAIRGRFGDAVTALVDECSDTDQTPKPPWRERKEAYLAHLERASDSARLIAAADKLDNVRSLLANYRREGPALWSHFRGGEEGTLWYHREVVQRLKQRDSSPLVDELDLAVTELERLATD
ncbi:MAG: HD domain-containing protein [Pirellulales bacterium]|nr:HD domain-containing protein [Pirellulales bacterium]